MFQNYRIKKENLLNRTGDITDDGEYESSFTEPTRILGAALENLTTGRLGITQESVSTLTSAIVIATRYAALRKQFGSNGLEEIPIIEYQLLVIYFQLYVFIYFIKICLYIPIFYCSNGGSSHIWQQLLCLSYLFLNLLIFI